MLAVDSGIPALILFIIISSMVLNSLWKYKEKSLAAKVTFWGLVTYFIQAIFFDPILPSNLIFYTLLGVGFRYVIKDKQTIKKVN